MDWLTVLGILAFAVGLMLSIALHEIGHLVPAKLFGIKVTQYMVGFGRTVWSRRRGETEYGYKAIPLGGYVRMIGMFPPEPGDDPRRLRKASTGPFQALVEDARRVAKEEIQAGDEDRVFYRKAWWKKLVVMLGGPAMNVLIAAVLAGGVLMIHGQAELRPVVSEVSACVIPVADGDRACTADDPPTPAAEAGFRAGDRLVSFAGVQITSWSDAQELIRSQPAGPVDVVVERNGREVTLTPELVTTERRALGEAEADGFRPPTDELETVGFLGVAPTQEVVPQDLGGAVAWLGDFAVATAQAVISIPERMVGVWDAAFGGGEREIDGPIGIVGAGRIGGEIATLDVGVADRVASFVLLLASFNMAIALFNLIPLLPLDGGHAAGAIWEGIKRGWARLSGGPMPRPVDVAKALPLAYGVATLLIGMSVLLLYADIVNPVRLPG
ncbi:MAG TPA: site-2 protease family protein [Jiangellaceae bacterium]|nr:site-2 protease family protein [Jiangellaceae bacterium]